MIYHYKYDMYVHVATITKLGTCYADSTIETTLLPFRPKAMAAVPVVVGL